MLESIKRMLSSNVAAEDAIDPHVAAAALFAEAALIDGVYAEIEEGRVQSILAEAFDLTPEQAEELLRLGETMAEEAVDAHRFTTRVKSLEMSRREKVVEGLYYVALADGERCAFEDAFIRHVASLLHIDDVRRAQARQRAEQRHRRD